MIEKVLPRVDLVQGFDLLSGMEYTIRNCYQSYDKTSKTNLLEHIVKSGHDSCLEFSEIVVILKEGCGISKPFWEVLRLSCQYPYILEFRSSKEVLFTGNLRAWLNMIDYTLQFPSPLIYRDFLVKLWYETVKHYPFLEAIEYGDILPKKTARRVHYGMDIVVRNIFDVEDQKDLLKEKFPTYWRDGRRVVFHIICSKACQNQIVRHRRFSFLIESQRLILPDVTACSVMICGTLSGYRHFVALRDSNKEDREIAIIAKETRKWMEKL